jgi:general secretion pathway protein D
VNKIPGLGDLPVLGKLFSTTEKTKGKSDVMLTITPRVIRGLSAPEGGVQSFWSGTEETYATQPVFSPSESVSQPSAPGGTAPFSSSSPSTPGPSGPLPPGFRPPAPTLQAPPGFVAPLPPSLPAPSTVR